MQEKKTMKECAKKIMAVRDALDIFSGKWKIPIIGVLITFKESGFKELQRTIGDITPKMLSKELKELEMNKLITRTILNTHPVSVKYEITSYGETCMDVIMSLYKWGLGHRKRMIGRE